MNVSIFTFESERTLKVKKEIENKLQALGLTLCDKVPDIVITIGGDGTVLKGVHHYHDRLDKVNFIGVHTGTLGYYTDWLPSEIDELATFIQNQEFEIASYPLIKATIQTKNERKEAYALNEFTVLNATRAQHLDIKINDMFLESFRGTGVCVSTPTGSTAYNKSLGGAVIYPSIPAFQLTEMASINNNAYRTIGSPLIIPSEQTLTLESENWEGMDLTQDHLSLNVSDLESIQISLSERKVRFIKRSRGLFWERVKNHFI